MRHLVDQYIDSMAFAWSATTIKSERYRLRSVADKLNGEPKALWEALQAQGPYSRVTTWTRVCAFWDWVINERHASGPNHYRVFRKRFERLFKNCYRRQVPSLTLAEARERIGHIGDKDIREKALELLHSGMRYSESFTFNAGEVVGKGNKRREVFRSHIPAVSYSRSYDTFRRALKAVGLKPHDLRKIYFTEIVSAGANPFELMELAGWSSMDTALSYINTKKPTLAALSARVGERSASK